MYKATINNKSFEITTEGGNLIVNERLLNWDLVNVGDNCFHILHQNRSYRAEVINSDATLKTFNVKINNHIYSVALKDKFDLLLEKMGMSAAASNKVNQIKAPMPGLIIDLKVNDGDRVKAGDPLLILEAMKMENIIKSLGEATVRSVKVKKGDRVDKGQILIEF